MGGTSATSRRPVTSTRQRSQQRPSSHSRRRYTELRSASGISCWVKYLVFGFNIVFWIVGFMMLVIGVWAQLEKNNPYTQLNRLSKFYLDPAWMLIIFGTLTFAIGFSGCIGALRENTFFLAIYSSLLGLLLLAELCVVVLAFISKDWIEAELKTRLDDMVILYREDPDLQTLIDWISRTVYLCLHISSFKYKQKYFIIQHSNNSLRMEK